ncbi:MAG TPA: LptF/LptG family permease [Puia sp.]|jgi:lipopolysaccharide export system permease protein|nr:LptF/LptG family permease [Puia sp.]
MKLLDWYILKRFFITFFFTILAITAIAVVIDTSEKADDFVNSGLSTWKIITNYYVGFVPFIISMISPLMIFIAVIYFTSRMAGRSEIVAILAGGIRFNRFLRPYMIGALLLSGIFWIASQTWIPKANKIRTDFQAYYVDRNSSYQPNAGKPDLNNYYLRSDTNTYVALLYYDTAGKSAGGFTMQKVKNNKIYLNLRAERIQWDTAKKNWHAYNIIQHSMDGLHESSMKIKDSNFNINIRPNELGHDEYLKDKLTSPQLKEFIKREELRGTEGLNNYKVERYHRDSTPFSIIILTVMGAVIASRKVRGGSGLHLALGIVAAALFVVMDKFAITFSTKGNFPPMLAAWIPNIIFSCVTVWLYKKAPK